MSVMKELKLKFLFVNTCLAVTLSSAAFFEQKKELNGKVISTTTESSALQCLHRCRFIDKTSVAKYKASQCKCFKIDNSGPGTLHGLLQKQIETVIRKEEKKDTGPPPCIWLDTDSSAGAFARIPNCQSWSQCQKFCKDRSLCKSWKWVSGEDKGTERLKCSIMMTVRKDKVKKNSVFGLRECTDYPK